MSVTEAHRFVLLSKEPGALQHQGIEPGIATLFNKSKRTDLVGSAVASNGAMRAHGYQVSKAKTGIWPAEERARFNQLQSRSPASNARTGQA